MLDGKTAAAGTAAGFIYQISAAFSLLQPLEAQYRSERIIAFDTACVPTVSWVIREESFMALIVAEKQQKSYKQAPRRTSSVFFNSFF